MTKIISTALDIDTDEKRSTLKNGKIITCISLAGLIALALILNFTLLANAAPQSAHIYISEVVSSNNFSYVDETLASPDWIELYNASDSDISLHGFGISDNPAVPYKYTFGDVVIGGGEYLVVYAAPDIAGEQICLGFSLSKEGEKIGLTDAQGRTVQILSIPALSEDIAWGRTAASEYKYIAEPTAGQENSIVWSDTLDGCIKPSETSHLVINEIMPTASELLDGEEKNYAWIEVYNTGAEKLNLKNYYLTDNKIDLKKWRFPDIEIGAYEYLVVYASGEDTAGLKPHTNFKLSEKETAVYLTNGNTGISTEMSWDGGLPKHMSAGLNDSGDIEYFSIPTPGTENTTKAYSGFENAQMDCGLEITEIMLDNSCAVGDGDGDRPAWVEFCNNSGYELKLDNFYLSDNRNNPYKWQFPATELKSGEYMLVYLSGKDKKDGELHTGFKLSGNEETLVITDRENMEESLFCLGIDKKPDVSYGVNADGMWAYFGQATPGAENAARSFTAIDDAKMFDINGVYINEVCAVSAPKTGDTDWIEIANKSGSELDLTGYYLSDSIDEPYKWQLPEINVPADGFTVIYASSDSAEQIENTAPFGISASGETLLLSSPDGVLIDRFDTGVLSCGLSSGRMEGDVDGGRVFFTNVTKGKANADECCSSYTPVPVFSELGGYKEKGALVKITCEDENATIYYTTNGDEPTPSSKVYTEGIEINKSLPLRAVAVSPGLLLSPVTTENYLVEEKHEIDVLCISGDWSDINYSYSSSKYNREVGVHIEYFEQDGKKGVAFPAGIRVVGLVSRSYPQKSLNIYLRGGYGQSSVVYPFFDNYPIVDYQSLTIRNSGQDIFNTHMKTAFFEMAANDLNIDNIQHKPVAVYINGKYWGMYWLCENQNEDCFASKYGFDRNDIEVIRRNYSAAAGSNEEFLAVRKFARSHDMSIEENYKEFITMVNEQAFMDYIIMQTYICNWDMYNQKYWRTTDYEHEWRPMLYDLDYAFRYPGASYLGSYFSKYGVTWETGDGSKTNMDIPYALLQNEGWKQAFIERYAYLLRTTFAPENITALYDIMTAEIESEMSRHIKRWHVPYSMNSWEKQTEKLRNILLERDKQCMRDLQKYFKLSDERMAELFPDDGY